jgi:superfamily II DNA/RNA helicase
MSQINDEAIKFSSETGLRIVVAYGGTPMYNQVIAASMHFDFGDVSCFDF